MQMILQPHMQASRLLSRLLSILNLPPPPAILDYLISTSPSPIAKDAVMPFLISEHILLQKLKTQLLETLVLAKINARAQFPK
jgi:hypothetical protein